MGSYLDIQPKIDEIVNRLEKAYESELLEKSGKTEFAYRKWQIIFGNYFPSYG